MPLEVIRGPLPTEPSAPLEVIRGALPEPEEPGLLDQIGSLMAKPGEMLRSTVGASTPEEVETSTRNYLGPILGQNIASGLGRAHGAVYSAATDPLSLIPFGAIAKRGAAGVKIVQSLNRAFTALQSAGATQSIDRLAEQIKDAYAKGKLTPELAQALVDTAMQVAGVILGVKGERNIAAQRRTAEAAAGGPEPAVRSAISSEDAAILERISASRRQGPEALEDALREVSAARPPEAATPDVPPSAIRDVRGEYVPVEGQGLLPEPVAREAELADLIQRLEAEARTPGPPEPPAVPSTAREPQSASELRPVLADDVTLRGPTETQAVEVPIQERPPTETQPVRVPIPDTPPTLEQRAGIPDSEIARDFGAADPQARPYEDRVFETLAGTDYTKAEAARAADIEAAYRASIERRAPKTMGPEAGAALIPDIEPGRLQARAKEAAAAADKFVGTVAGLTKAIPFGGDASVLLNQNLKLGVINPKGFIESALLLPKAAFSPKAAAALKAQLAATDQRMGGLMKKSGLDLMVTDDVADALRNDWAQRVPALKQYLGASERAYTAPLSSLRASTFLDLVSPHLAKGKTFASDPQLFKGYAELVNVLSGRGDLGRLRGAAGLLNAVFVSPRNMAAKFQQFTMLGRRDVPLPVKLELLKTHAKFYSGYAGLLTMAKLAGYEVETEDPASPDFGKIRDGKVRIDLGTGDLALFRALSILKEGKRTLLSGEKRRETPGETTLTFLENKLAPLARAVTDWSRARTDAKREEAFKRLAEDMRPLWAGQDIQKLLSEDTSGITKPLFGATSFAGGRMNIYDEPAALTAEDKSLLRREESAQDEAIEVRSRTDLPKAPPKSRREQAESAEKSVRNAKFLERAVAALRKGDMNAAFDVQMEAKMEGYDLNIMELEERLAQAGAAGPEQLMREARP